MRIVLQTFSVIVDGLVHEPGLDDVGGGCQGGPGKASHGAGAEVGEPVVLVTMHSGKASAFTFKQALKRTHLHVTPLEEELLSGVVDREVTDIDQCRALYVGDRA